MVNTDILESLEITYRTVDTYWKIGFVRLGDYKFDFEAKVFLGNSMFGINEGRISKLFVTRKGRKNPYIVYEREWISKPKDFLGKVLLSILLKEFS